MLTSPMTKLCSLSETALAELTAVRQNLTFCSNYPAPGSLGDRVSESVLIDPGVMTRSLYAEVIQLFVHLNGSYDVDIASIEEPITLIRYDVDGRLDWHLDCGQGEGARRKLSVSIQLSCSSDYDGGDLEFAGAPQHPFGRDQYAATVFPSYLAHRVTPVTRGTREALVAWIHGSSYR